MSDTLTIMTEAIRSLTDKIQAKKLLLIGDRLKQMGLSHLMDGDGTRRFKRIMMEKHPDREIYYADNGTVDGVRIITFVEEQETIHYPDENVYKAIINMKYF